ncbi:hypothetical protein EDD92_9200 [Streptomyces sp. TLI_185]|nr:hypothetical protein EDD92_9200 [Streptomyces sp. TLI_185]
MTAAKVVIDADAPEVAVGVDGESRSVRTPVTCRIQPTDLRVHVPRHRPGVPDTKPSRDWRTLLRLAFGRRPPRRPGR